MTNNTADRLFKLRLQSLMGKLDKLGGQTPIQASLFIVYKGRLITFQSDRGWPCLPSDIDDVLINPDEQFGPANLADPTGLLRKKVAELESLLKMRDGSLDPTGPPESTLIAGTNDSSSLAMHSMEKKPRRPQGWQQIVLQRRENKIQKRRPLPSFDQLQKLAD
ncbi:hypothetical protein JX265_009498 [Neoarthrinium moseri]|uniref:Uncharacterized protein n=1 Tax=Neoarthrinium moseri TaxID=1658444 RepID=A0A9P9WG26_9PEZI|nr:hypothetical protein JX265_009498 [Neoarthrinium moseri]